MSINIKFFLLFILVLKTFSSIAQDEFRAYEYNDSTFHVINSDTTVVVSKNRIYYKTSSGLNLCKDYSLYDSSYYYLGNGAFLDQNYFESNFYIRDFDTLTSQHWFVVVGSRYIGELSFLFKTTNQGQTWERDTLYHTAVDSLMFSDVSNYRSINKLKCLGSDTIILFMGYYTSGIVYSTDGGLNWRPWFSLWWSHWYEMFECIDSYYLLSIPGDGFASYLYRVPKDSLFHPNLLTNGGFSSCISGSGNTAPCIQPVLPPNINDSLNLYYFYKGYVTSICGPMTSTNQDMKKTEASINIYPNPLANKSIISWDNLEKPKTIKVIDLNGIEVELRIVYGDNHATLESDQLPSGIYIVCIQMGQEFVYRKIVKQ